MDEKRCQRSKKLRGPACGAPATYSAIVWGVSGGEVFLCDICKDLAIHHDEIEFPNRLNKLKKGPNR